MWWNDDFAFSEVEKNHRPQQLGIFKLLTGSDKKDPNDPYQFAPAMGDAMLKKVPKHIVITQEFCDFYRDSNDYANLLKKNGKLLELLATPGKWHMSEPNEADMKTCFSYL